MLPFIIDDDGRERRVRRVLLSIRALLSACLFCLPELQSPDSQELPSAPATLVTCR